LKRFISILCITAFAAVGIFSTTADAEPSGKKYGNNVGTTQLSSVGFSSINHSATDVLIDTLLVAEADTTTRVEVAGAKSVGLMVIADGRLSVGHNLTITPRVSYDGTNWSNLTVSFTAASSADKNHVFVMTGAANTDTSAFPSSDYAKVVSARDVDFIVTKADLTGADSVLTQIKVLRTY
jgi:hypothetical protein